MGDGFGSHEAIQTGHQRILQGGRNDERRERPGQCVVPINSFEVSRFKNGFGHFLDEEWNPIRLLDDLGEHLVWQGFAIRHPCHNLFHLDMG